MAHVPVKPSKLVGTVAPLVVGDLVLPRLFRRESIEKYKGSASDTLTFRVPGTLPAREYAWRNNRSSGLVFDEYSETTVTVSVGANAYSAVRLNDEQSDMDFEGWTTLLDAQSQGVAAYLKRGAAAAVEAAPYQVVLKSGLDDLRAILVKARNVLNKFGVGGPRVLVVGTDWESALLLDDKLALAQNVGDQIAVDALTEAKLGRRYGFNIVVDQTIDPGDAFAFGPDAFIWASLVPGIPRGVPFGSTTSFDGVAMRWILDYDPEYLRDRSIVNTYYGFRPVKDQFKFWDLSQNPDQEEVQATQYFVRGIKLELADGTDTLPAEGSDVGLATGVFTPDP